MSTPFSLELQRTFKTFLQEIFQSLAETKVGDFGQVRPSFKPNVLAWKKMPKRR